MKITGGCLCGAVRFESTAPPLVTRVCWCRLCQYLGAGSGTVNVCFKTENFSVRGATQEFSSVADSGNVVHRAFCPACGTPMFSSAEVRPHLIFVRAGTLDDPEVARPAMTIWTEKAPSWGSISADIPRIERQPPPPGSSP
jgi:hypothetical protein